MNMTHIGERQQRHEKGNDDGSELVVHLLDAWSRLTPVERRRFRKITILPGWVKRLLSWLDVNDPVASCPKCATVHGGTSE